jgi:hypothetical protein
VFRTAHAAPRNDDTGRFKLSHIWLSFTDVPNFEIVRGLSVPEQPPQRACLDCEGQMVIIHKGEFTTVYACNTCGATMTIPPKFPVTTRKEPDWR